MLTKADIPYDMQYSPSRYVHIFVYVFCVCVWFVLLQAWLKNRKLFKADLVAKIGQVQAYMHHTHIHTNLQVYMFSDIASGHYPKLHENE